MFCWYAYLIMLCLILRFAHGVKTVWRVDNTVCEFQPRRLRDFMVTSASGEQQVKRFYAWLDRTDCNASLHASADSTAATDAVTDAGNARMLEALYCQEHMWAQLAAGADGAVVYQWMYLVHMLFVTHIAAQVSTPMSDKIDVLCKQFMKLFLDLMRYSNVYMHAQFPLIQQRTNFLQHVLRLALTSSACHGFLPGFLLFAHLCPELVTDECYPFLNNETHVYQHVVDLWEVEQFSPLYADLIYKFESYVNL